MQNTKHLRMWPIAASAGQGEPGAPRALACPQRQFGAGQTFALTVWLFESQSLSCLLRIGWGFQIQQLVNSLQNHVWCCVSWPCKSGWLAVEVPSQWCWSVTDRTVGFMLLPGSPEGAILGHWKENVLQWRMRGASGKCGRKNCIVVPTSSACTEWLRRARSKQKSQKAWDIFNFYISDSEPKVSQSTVLAVIGKRFALGSEGIKNWTCLVGILGGRTELNGVFWPWRESLGHVERP